MQSLDPSTRWYLVHDGTSRRLVIPVTAIIVVDLIFSSGYTANASAISLFLPENIETDSAVEREAIVGGVDSHGRDPALVAAVVFYLLARGFCVGLLAYVCSLNSMCLLLTPSSNSMYAKALPQFSAALLFASAHQVADLVIYFPLLFVTSKPIIIVLACLGMALDILLQSVKRQLYRVRSMT